MQKNKFPPYSTCTSNDMIRVPHTCLLLPGPSFILEGYFVLSAALSLITKWSHAFLSLYYMVVCRYTCRNQENSSCISQTISFRIYSFINDINLKKKIRFFFPHGCKLPSFLFTPCSPPKRLGLAGLSVECFSFCRQPRQYIKREVFGFACFIVRKITFLRDKLSSIFHCQKDKAARWTGPVLEDFGNTGKLRF